MNALRRGLLPLLFLLLAIGNVQAETAVPVHFTATAQPSPAHPGEAVTITIRARIDPGWHVYSVIPAATGPAATQIASLGNAVPLGLTAEDTPTQKFDPNFQTQVAYHENTATFTRQFRVTSSASAVTLHYQTCDARVCLPPTDIVLPLTLTVVPGPVRHVPPAPNSGATAPEGGGRELSSRSPCLGGRGTGTVPAGRRRRGAAGTHHALRLSADPDHAHQLCQTGGRRQS